jgi:hypothetical protein
LSHCDGVEATHLADPDEGNAAGAAEPINCRWRHSEHVRKPSLVHERSSWRYRFLCGDGLLDAFARGRAHQVK